MFSYVRVYTHNFAKLMRSLIIARTIFNACNDGKNRLASFESACVIVREYLNIGVINI